MGATGANDLERVRTGLDDGSPGASRGELIRTTSKIVWGSTDQEVQARQRRALISPSGSKAGNGSAWA